MAMDMVVSLLNTNTMVELLQGNTMVVVSSIMVGMQQSTSQSTMEIKSTRRVLWTRSKTRSMVTMTRENQVKRRRRRTKRSMMDMNMAMTAAAVTVIRSHLPPLLPLHLLLCQGVWDGTIIHRSVVVFYLFLVIVIYV